MVGFNRAFEWENFEKLKIAQRVKTQILLPRYQWRIESQGATTPLFACLLPPQARLFTTYIQHGAFARFFSLPNGVMATGFRFRCSSSRK